MRADRPLSRRTDAQLRLACFAAVVGIRAALWVLPYQRIRQRLPTGAMQDGSRFYARQVAARIAAAARFVPGASCLTQALAAQFILARAGHGSTIRIGVGTGGARGLAAHAWLVCEGQVVLGGRGQDLSAFTLLTELR